MNPQTSSTESPVALVTGGAGGLGRVITDALLMDGYRVGIVDIDQRGLDDAVARIDPSRRDSVLAVTADITNEESVRRSVAAVTSAWGPVDALVNNAGIEPPHSITDLDMSVWDATFAVNVRAPMMYVKHCVPGWLERSSGTVAFIGSRTWLSGSNHVAYGSSKAALVGLARSVASSLGPVGVTANVVAPSFVRTPLHTEDNVEDYARKFIEATPMKRLIDPIDIANSVAFLVSPRARNITGEVLHVAAGMQLAPVISI